MWVALTREKMASVRPRFFTRPLIFISISLSPSYGIVRLYLLWKLSLAIFSPKISYPGSTHLHKPGGEKLQLKMKTKKQSRKQRLEKYNKEEEAWTHNRPSSPGSAHPFRFVTKTCAMFRVHSLERLRFQIWQNWQIKMFYSVGKQLSVF